MDKIIESIAEIKKMQEYLFKLSISDDNPTESDLYCLKEEINDELSNLEIEIEETLDTKEGEIKDFNNAFFDCSSYASDLIDYHSENKELLIKFISSIAYAEKIEELPTKEN